MTTVLVLLAAVTLTALAVDHTLNPRRDLWDTARRAPATGLIPTAQADRALARLEHRLTTSARPLTFDTPVPTGRY